MVRVVFNKRVIISLTYSISMKKVPHVLQELSTFPEHTSSHPLLIFCALFCRPCLSFRHLYFPSLAASKTNGILICRQYTGTERLHEANLDKLKYMIHS